ncbi:MAG: TonB-dependent receptor [Terriglobales bacterium]
MGRKVGSLLLLVTVALSVPVWAGQGSISGKVKNARGVPQMGAMVEVVSLSASKVFTVFTDNTGYYLVDGLGAGPYDVKVSAASFLPTLLENVSLRSGTNVVINLTLNTLTDAIRLLPAKQGTQEDDDWKWTLRSSANRPILRVANGQPVIVANAKNDRPLKASVAFVAGNDGTAFTGSSEMSTRVNVERSLFQTGLLSFNGDVGYGLGPNATVLRTSYAHEMPDGSRPEVAVTLRRFATSPTMALHDAALEAMTVRASDSAQLAGFIELHAGAEFETVQFLGHVNAYKPFGSMDIHLSPNSVVEYQYTTSIPNMRWLKGFDSAPADMTESGPRMTLLDSQSVLERAQHQEVSVSHRRGKYSMQAAYFHDRINDAALTGVGEVSAELGNLLPDAYSGTFAYNGGRMETNGVRLVVQRQLPDGITAAMDYAYGGVLDLNDGVQRLEDVRSHIEKSYQHSLAGKITGSLPHAKTQWITSYKWTSGGGLTPVDVFNSGPGQTDSYLNVFIRQPVPGTTFMPAKMEALLDIRNLLAQGYHPVVGSDGQTVYLVQAARSVRGGVAFVF